MDYKDVCQIISLHIYHQIHTYDQEKTFIKWCNRVITNKMLNLIRDNYWNLAPPCNRCMWNDGEDKCGYTANGLKNNSCQEYEKWSKNKKTGYNMKLAQSIDHPDFLEQRKDVKENCDANHNKTFLLNDLKQSLNDTQKRILDFVFIGSMKDQEFSKKYKISAAEVKKHKQYIIDRAKEILDINLDE